MSQENNKRCEEKMFDELKDTFFCELTDLGKDFITQNTRKVIEAAASIVKEIISICITSSKSDKTETNLRKLIDKAVADGCEIGYQAGRTQKVQLMIYALSRTGFNSEQIRKVLDIIKDSETEFEETYNTYEKYAEFMQNVTQRK